MSEPHKETRVVEWWAKVRRAEYPDETKACPPLRIRLAFDADLAEHLDMEPHDAQAAVEGMIEAVQIIALRRPRLELDLRREYLEPGDPAEEWKRLAIKAANHLRKCPLTADVTDIPWLDEAARICREIGGSTSVTMGETPTDDDPRRTFAGPVRDATTAGEITDAHGQRWRPSGPGEYEPILEDPEPEHTADAAEPEHRPGPAPAGHHDPEDGSPPPGPIPTEQQPPDTCADHRCHEHAKEIPGRGRYCRVCFRTVPGQ